MGAEDTELLNDTRLQYQLEALKQELEEAKDQAELNLLQLQQVQEELEFYFLAHQEQQGLLDRYGQEAELAEGLIASLLEQLEARG
ncbi:MAG: hypothetical protein N3Z29_01640 [Synechococcaceae cyanobacterium MAG-AL1]|nr:hypothetical protein [Candidatus Regnicoccus frigidus MAG-AL1]